jgi:hypothetical protein
MGDFLINSEAKYIAELFFCGFSRKTALVSGCILQ